MSARLKEFTKLGTKLVSSASELDMETMQAHCQKVGNLCTRHATQGTWPGVSEWLSTQTEIEGAEECAACDLAVSRSGYGEGFDRETHNACVRTLSAMQTAFYLTQAGLSEVYWRRARRLWLTVLALLVVLAILIFTGMIWYSLMIAGITVLISGVVLSVYCFLFYRRYATHRDEFQFLLDEATVTCRNFIPPTVIPAG
jgi:hypothetical protein